MNKLFLIGRVGKDPEIIQFENGNKIAKFSLATTERWKSKDGEKQERTDWHNIKIGQKGLVDLAEKYITKGMKLAIEGSVTYRDWEDKEGNKRTQTEINCHSFEFLSKSEKTGEAPGPITEEESDVPF